jgi:hypothetical protein
MKEGVLASCAGNQAALTISSQAFNRLLKPLWKIRKNPHCEQPCRQYHYSVLGSSDTLSNRAGWLSVWRGYMDSLTVGLSPVQEEVRAMQYYSLPSALSDVGGIVGLFFGTSILSLYESFELKFSREVDPGFGFKRRMKFQSEDNQQTCTYPYYINTLMRRQIYEAFWSKTNQTNKEMVITDFLQ